MSSSDEEVITNAPHPGRSARNSVSAKSLRPKQKQKKTPVNSPHPTSESFDIQAARALNQMDNESEESGAQSPVSAGARPGTPYISSGGSPSGSGRGSGRSGGSTASKKQLRSSKKQLTIDLKQNHSREDSNSDVVWIYASE